MIKRALKDIEIRQIQDLESIQDLNSVEIFRFFTQDKQVYDYLKDQVQDQLNGKTVYIDTRRFKQEIKYDQMMGFHDFSAQIADWFYLYAKNITNLHIILDKVSSQLTETDIQFYTGSFSCFNNLNVLEFSTGGKTAMDLWNSGNYEDAHFYVKKQVKNNFNKSMGLAAKQLGKQLEKMAFKNKFTLHTLSLDLYRWSSCTSADTSFLFKCLKEVLVQCTQIKTFYLNLYGWVGIIDYKCFDELAATFKACLTNCRQLENIELHFAWCQSLTSWQASISLAESLKYISQLSTLRNFTLNLGGWGQESSVVPETLFENLASLILNNPLSSLFLTFGNWKNPLKIETTLECLEAMLMKLVNKPNFYRLGLDLWGWTNGSVKGLLCLAKALVKIRQTTDLQDLSINFWEWQGIINPECAIELILQILNPPYKKNTLKYLSLNMNAWYLSKEPCIKFFQCIRKMEAENHLEKLNLSCRFEHHLKKYKFNNPNGRIFGKNVIKLIACKDQKYQKAASVCKAINNTQLFLTDKMQKDFYKLCFLPSLDNITQIELPLSYNLQG
ncbi:hypothetical protein TTHERM_00214720 (macronuclear) [Tetrahymena thermophila SB210]|uniref:Kinase domain protein n=1 Tax=Tetrahymena thermophila (strain SB210) TaxID=312017 RepID=Q22N62_TETTS|nr:hypothetical protein TTHERM_00214720 [Tetrahymena thermophila SB210]EAR86923.2 hypothetical protein TTHERM_00214720 [Tetrahymena thermophila SB210]|eukprot:XP_001007168.2 hypothetical protein TTHERM_00214720 [Tetrahymena thermophila SB210]